MDAIRRATDVMMAGKVAVVCGYGDVGERHGRQPPRCRCPGGGHRDRSHLRPAGRHGRLRGEEAEHGDAARRTS